MIPTYNKFRIGAVETGARGKPGKSVYEIWLESGNKGTTEDFLKAMRGVEGKQGRPGIKGENVYEIWKKQPGNEGKTEQDFLNSMKGDKGDKGDKGGMYVPSISSDGVLSWCNDSNLENPQPFNISDLILNEVKESRVDTTGKTFTKLKERLDSDFKKLSECIKNNDTKDEVVQARTATTGENFMTLDDRIDHEVMRLREKIEVTMLEQEDKENHDISNTIDGMSSDMVIKGKTIKLDNGEIKSFGQEEDKISTLSHGKNLFNVNNSVQGLLNVNNGELFKTDDSDTSDYIKVEKGKNYIINGEGGEIRGYYGVFYDANKNYIEHKTFSKNIPFTFEREGYFRFSYASKEDNLTATNIMFLEGTQATQYESYKCDKKDILLQNLGFDEGLRGINVISDELNSLRNVAIKRIGKREYRVGDELLENIITDKMNTYYVLAEPIETPLNENINVKTFNDKTYVSFKNSINGTSSFKVPVNTNKLINDLKFEKEELKEKFNNLTNEFEKFKTLMIQTLPYKEEE